MLFGWRLSLMKGGGGTMQRSLTGLADLTVTTALRFPLINIVTILNKNALVELFIALLMRFFQTP